MERSEILEKIVEIASDVLGTNPDDVNEQTTCDGNGGRVRPRDR